MALLSKEVKLGESVEIRYQPELAGVVVAVDDTWKASLRVSSGRIGGPVVANATITIVEDAEPANSYIKAVFSTSDLSASTYYYDMCIVAPGETPRWHGETVLTVKPSNSPVPT